MTSKRKNLRTPCLKLWLDIDDNDNINDMVVMELTCVFWHIVIESLNCPQFYIYQLTSIFYYPIFDNIAIENTKYIFRDILKN